MSVFVGVFSLAVLIGGAIKAGKRTAQAANRTADCAVLQSHPKGGRR